MKTRNSLKEIIAYQEGKKKAGAVKLSSNENPLGSSPKAIEAIRANTDYSIYPDVYSDELRHTLAAKNGVSPDRIIIGNGSDELMVLIAGTCIETGVNGIIAENTFSEYEFALRMMGGDIKKIPLTDGTYNPAAMAEAVNENTAVIFLCNPNNPTGTYFSEKELTSALDTIPSDVLVVLDEAYYDYVSAEDYPSSINLLDRYPNIIILRTFSKLYGLASLRVGYAMAHEDTITNLRKVKQPFNINRAAQIGATAALADNEFITQSIETNETGKTYLYKELENLGLFYYPTQANFICINMERDCKKVFDEFADRGITIRPLASFGLDTWIRITIGTAEQNKKVVSILKEIC